MTSKTLLLSTFLFVSPLTASAAILQVEDDLSVTIPIQDDYYGAGGTVSIREAVLGDAIVAGGEIDVDADISQDLTLLGGDVDVRGSVGDDVRIGGGTVHFAASAGDDVMIFGGEVSIRPNATIAGDLQIFGGDIVIDGDVAGNLYVYGGSVTIHGNVQGFVHIESDSLVMNGNAGGDVRMSAVRLEVGPEAAFAGNVYYWQPGGEYAFEDGQVQGQITYDQTLAREIEDDVKGITAVIAGGLFTYSLLASAFIILLSVLITKTYFGDAAKRLRKAPGLSLWYGFLYVISVPFLSLLFCLTVIGIPIGLMLIILYFFTFFFIKPFTSIVLARVVEQKYGKKWGTVQIFFVSVGILVLWKFLALVPILGVILSILLVLVGFGSLAHTEWVKFKKVR